MIRIGRHLPSPEGYQAMTEGAIKIDANTFQFLTRNPKSRSAKAVNGRDIRAFLLKTEGEDVSPILAHAPYTLSAYSADPRLRDFAKRTTADDLVRMEYTPGNMYNFHPRCHVEQGVDVSVSYIAGMLDEILTSEQTTTVLLEAMTGKGGEIGVTFRELKQILDLVDLSNHTGVCLDICHIWDGGYGITNHLEEVLDKFNQVIGLNRLKAIHLNDNQNPLGAHKDKHTRLDEGHIGIDTFYKIVTHPILSKLPFYLETPNDLNGYRREIHMMREAADL